MTEQLSLFGNREEPDRDKTIVRVPGLSLVENYISIADENLLLESIDAEPWLEDLSRRVQHYGFKYDYRARRIDSNMQIGPIPDWCFSVGERLKEDGYFCKIPDQVIINEYTPGQGISPHIDCEPCFEDTIASLSLGSTATMDFTSDSPEQKQSVFLARRSLVVLQQESRYSWKHSIPKRKSDKQNGQKLARQRRVSLTFRSVIISD